MDERNLGNMKEESMFNCWCNTGLIATSNSFLKNPELEIISEIREIKIHLLNVLPIQFHSTINGSFILGEYDLSTICLNKVILVVTFLTIIYLENGILIDSYTRQSTRTDTWENSVTQFI